MDEATKVWLKGVESRLDKIETDVRRIQWGGVVAVVAILGTNNTVALGEILLKWMM